MTGASRPGLTEATLKAPVDPGAYAEFIGQAKVDELRRLAEPLRGRGWANVNSSLAGGGVAELLGSMLPLARGLGIDARWYAMRAGDEFFRVTKKFHNLLQGLPQDLTLEEVFQAYLETIDARSREAFITSDLVVVHDPQPAALVMNGVLYGNVLWRCHIDTSAPDMTVWRFLLPYINHCAGAVFTRKDYVGPGLQVPVYQVYPGIDPLARKNRLLTRAQALDVLAPVLADLDVDPERPILACVSRFDPHKNQADAIRAFRELRRESRRDPAPYLILMGNSADDDPEQGGVLAGLRELAGDDPDIRFLVDAPDNDAVVGALMRAARGLVHAATREGFGLVVAEALWQGTPVIGARAGGIPLQVLDGETGLLADPGDVPALARAMARILDDADLAEALGRRGHEHVRGRFLMPQTVERYLRLMRHYARVDREAPDFRLSELTYSEVIGAMRPRPPFFPDSE
ncbi:glycosyltransferase [Desulfocurvus sp. DL9XJH121]